jgi:hypothetical protein
MPVITRLRSMLEVEIDTAAAGPGPIVRRTAAPNTLRTRTHLIRIGGEAFIVAWASPIMSSLIALIESRRNDSFGPTEQTFVSLRAADEYTL